MPDSVPLRGSAYHPAGGTRPGHRTIRKLTDAELHADAGVTLMLRERRSGPTTAQSLAWLQSLPDPRARHLDIAQLTARHGFDTADRDRVVRWATAAGLQVTGEDAATRRIMLRGRVEQLSRAFEVDLERFGWTRPDGRSVEYRGHRGPARLPAHLDGIVEGVFGLDDRPLARSHVRGVEDGRSAVFAYDPPQLASLYNFPRLANGGEGVELVAAMIELGGVVHPFDLAASFARLGLPAPDITNVWLDGATPAPDPNGADVEVALDYQVIGAMVMAMAPKAHLTIVSYNAPNTRARVHRCGGDRGERRDPPSGCGLDQLGRSGGPLVAPGHARARCRLRHRRAARRDVQRCGRRCRLDQRRGGRLPAPGIPGVEPTRLGVRWHHAARGSRPHPDRDGLERAGSWSGGGRERCQHGVPGARVPGRAGNPPAICGRRSVRTRTSGRVGQRRSADRLERGRPAPAAVNRRHQRCGSDVHRALDACVRAARAPHRAAASGALRPSRPRVQRCHRG